MNSKRVAGGRTLVGYYATLSTTDGALLQSCYSPCSFAMNDGHTYHVAVGNYAGETSNHWSDDAETVETRAGSRTVSAQAAGTTINLTAVYSP